MTSNGNIEPSSGEECFVSADSGYRALKRRKLKVQSNTG